MLLALSEIRYNKVKFSLIVLSLSLVVFLLLMLSALGSGLIVGMAGAIQSLDTDLIIYQNDSHLNLQRSSLPILLKDDISKIDGIASVVPFGQIVATAKSGKETFDSSLILTTIDPIVNPKVMDGQNLKEGDPVGVVVDRSITRYGVVLGDDIIISSTDKKLKVVGITTGHRLSMMPTIYLTGNTWQEIKFDSIAKMTTSMPLKRQKSEFANAFLVKVEDHRRLNTLKAKLESTIDGIEVATKDEAINSFPGMMPMKMVVFALKGLSFAIGTIIVGIFFYILTLQKISQIGMLKAIGASSGYIFRDLIVQVVFLTLVGVAIGIVLSYSACKAIPPVISLSLNAQEIIPNTIGILAMSCFGALFSLRHIIKVDAGIAINQS